MKKSFQDAAGNSIVKFHGNCHVLYSLWHKSKVFFSLNRSCKLCKLGHVYSALPKNLKKVIVKFFASFLKTLKRFQVLQFAPRSAAHSEVYFSRGKTFFKIWFSYVHTPLFLLFTSSGRAFYLDTCRKLIFQFLDHESTMNDRFLFSTNEPSFVNTSALQGLFEHRHVVNPLFM